MDATLFDRLVVSMAGRRNRREVLKGILGLTVVGGTAVVAADGAEAARRGFSGPPLPGNPCVPDCGEERCGVSNKCGGICTCSGTDVCVEGECKAECEVQGLCFP